MAPRLLLLVAVALTASTATTTCWAFVPPSPPTNPTPTKPSTTKMDVARLDLYPGLKVSQSVSQPIYSIWIDLTLLREARDCYLAWGAKQIISHHRLGSQTFATTPSQQQQPGHLRHGQHHFGGGAGRGEGGARGHAPDLLEPEGGGKGALMMNGIDVSLSLGRARKQGTEGLID